MFPFTLRAQETRYHTSSPYGFRDAFLRAKPKDMSWFCFDVVIRSPAEVTFVIHDMRDTVYGGIGEVTAEIKAMVAPEVTRPHIEEQAMELARRRRRVELHAAEEAIVASYVQELLAAI